MLSQSRTDEVGIVPVVAEDGVEPGQTEVACQLAQVVVGGETHQRRRPAADSPDLPGLGCPGDRIHTHPISVSELVSERNGRSVHEDVTDLSVWNAERFDEVFHRSTRGNRERGLSTSEPGWEEVIELGLKPDGDRRHEW